jgi:hypothetical protein
LQCLNSNIKAFDILYSSSSSSGHEARPINDLVSTSRFYPSNKVKLSLCLTNHHAMKAYWGVEVWLHAFYDLGCMCRWVVNFAPRPLYLQGKSPWYALNRRLCGPQSQSGRRGEEKNSQPPSGIEP